MEQKFKAGDKVQLKSGSATMTVAWAQEKEIMVAYWDKEKCIVNTQRLNPEIFMLVN